MPAASSAQVPSTTPESRVCMDLRPGERISFGMTGVQVEVMAKSGRATRLRVTLPKDVLIQREGAPSFDPSMQ